MGSFRSSEKGVASFLLLFVFDMAVFQSPSPSSPSPHTVGWWRTRWRSILCVDPSVLRLKELQRRQKAKSLYTLPGSGGDDAEVLPHAGHVDPTASGTSEGVDGGGRRQEVRK